MAFDITDVKVSEGQKALASYIKKETGKVVKPEMIAVIDLLREAYRKDPARVAEREAQKEAARKRKLEAYTRAVEKAAALAKSLGIPGDFNVTGSDLAKAVHTEFEPETLDEDNGEEIGVEEDGWEEAEPEPEPAPVKKAPAKRAAAKKATVTPIRKEEPTPADEDTSAIVVVEQEDGWEADPDAAAEAGDDFFDDGAEEY